MTRRIADLESFVANIDYVSSVNPDTGEIVQVVRENGVQTTTTHEIDDLYANSAKNSVTLISGGGANA